MEFDAHNRSLDYIYCDHPLKSGKPCSRPVVCEGDKCYQHKAAAVDLAFPDPMTCPHPKSQQSKLANGVYCMRCKGLVRHTTLQEFTKSLLTDLDRML